MNILISGCNGQLGSCLRRLIGDNESAFNDYRFFFTDVAELDITDCDAIGRFVADNSIVGIINCAAYTAVDKAESDEQLCQRLNAEAPAFLAEAIEQHGGWIIQVSTDYVFDGTNHTPYTEDEQTNPIGVYGKTKLVGELNVLKLCRRAMVVRTAWLYSEYGNNFVKTMLRLGRERDMLGVVFDQIGSPTYAGDLAAAILTIVERGIQPGTFHFTNEGVCSWYDFALAIHEMAGISDCRVNPLHTADYPTPAARPHYSVLDKSKIKKAYKIDIPHWRSSLRRCLELMDI